MDNANKEDFFFHKIFEYYFSYLLHFDYMKRNSIIFLPLVSLSGLLFSVLTAYTLYLWEGRIIKVKFSSEIEDLSTVIRQQITLNQESLFGLQNIFESTEDISPDTFKSIAGSILARHPEVQALEWVMKISAEEYPDFISKMQNDFPDYEVTERNKSGLIVSAVKRELYMPVVYIEPLIGNQEAFGFDLASNSARFKTLIEVQNSGKVLATESINLVQGGRGFLKVMPVYAGFPLTVSKRKETLIGYVIGVFSFDDLFNNLSYINNSESTEFTLTDVTEGTPVSRIFLYSKSSEEKSTINRWSYSTDIVGIAGRTWRITATPSKGYVLENHTLLPWLVFVIGVLFSIFITYVLIQSHRQTKVVENVVMQRTQELHEANRKLSDMARLDGLTGIYNRRTFNEKLDEEWNRGLRDKFSLSLIMIDIDYFKDYNDHYGHQLGDVCLEKVAKAIQSISRRKADTVARYGGEEFAIILPNEQNPEVYAEKCLIAVRELNIEHNASKIAQKITISVGVNTITPSKESSSLILIRNADQALYNAKRSGRNRYEIVENKEEASLSEDGEKVLGIAQESVTQSI